jgi:hypothetical protein
VKPPIKSAVLWALLTAIPVELVNFWLAMPPLDVGLAPDAPWYANVLAGEWVILHLPGLRLASSIGMLDFGGPGLFILLASGYLDTALLIAIGIHCFRWLRPRKRPIPGSNQLEK